MNRGVINTCLLISRHIIQSLNVLCNACERTIARVISKFKGTHP